ncbi:MAG: hypothetical protein Q9159_006127 [Coniocarpon cinnabarinum]
MVTPRYIQRLIDELAHQQRKPPIPWALMFNTAMIVASTVIALPLLTFGATCASALLTNYHVDFLGSPVWTVYSLKPFWAPLGAGIVAAIARKTYHTESDKIVVTLAALLNIAITMPAAPLSSLAADAALKVVDGRPIRQSFHQAIGSARYPSAAALTSAVVLPLMFVIMILHILVADGVMRGHKAHERWNEQYKEVKADDLTRNVDSKAVDQLSNPERTTDLSEQKVFDVITGKALPTF